MMQAPIIASRTFPALQLHQFFNKTLHCSHVPLAATSSSFSVHTSRRSLSTQASVSSSLLIITSKRHRRVLSPHHYHYQHKHQYQCGDPSSSSSFITTNRYHNRHHHHHYRSYNYCRRSYTSRARGYLAGLHCSVSVSENDDKTYQEPEFPSFESAWEAIQQVPEELIQEFEDDLWNSESKRFVYGSRSVSVIDAIIEETGTETEIGPLAPTTTRTNGKMEGEGGESDSGSGSGSDINKENTGANTVFRYLILNERPNLVQTAVEIPHIGAPYNPHFHHDQSGRGRASPSPSPSPSPISQTHLGGLAMVLPLWYKAHARAHARAHAHAQINAENNDDVKKNLGNNGILEANENDNTDCKKLNLKLTQRVHVVGGAPNCVLIGAGGCSLAHTLAVNLYLNHDCDGDGDGNKNKEHGESDDLTSASVSVSTPSIPITNPTLPLTAIEACPEILHVAQKWFGAGGGRSG